MSKATSPSTGPTTAPSPGRMNFNWADADRDSDSEADDANSGAIPADVKVSPSLEAAVNSSATTPQRRAPATATTGATAADQTTTDAEAAALRELIFAESLTPSRHCQEVTIQAAIPYKLKSVWNAPSSTGSSPAAATAAGGDSPAGTTAQGKGDSPSSAVAGKLPRPLRMNRAVDELTSVLRQNGNSLPYDELMSLSQWRSRFQPSFGSLFTFLKRNRDIFHYRQSLVELVQEGNIVAELLKINWTGGAPSGSTPVKPAA